MKRFIETDNGEFVRLSTIIRTSKADKRIIRGDAQEGTRFTQEGGNKGVINKPIREVMILLEADAIQMVHIHPTTLEELKRFTGGNTGSM